MLCDLWEWTESACGLYFHGESYKNPSHLLVFPASQSIDHSTLFAQWTTKLIQMLGNLDDDDGSYDLYGQAI